MLLTDHVNATLMQNSTTVPINGGTGKYSVYMRTTKPVSVSNTAKSSP